MCSVLRRKDGALYPRGLDMKLLAFEITIALTEKSSCFSYPFSASVFFPSFFLFFSRDKERDRFLLKHHKVSPVLIERVQDAHAHT